MSRRPLIAGNWKMNLLGEGASTLATAVAAAASKANADVAIAPPAIWLERCLDAAGEGPLQVWGQNVGPALSGAYTGEISVEMLADVKAAGTLLGHSERRHVFGETNEGIAAKAKLVAESGLGVMLCVGETLDDRKQGRTMDVVIEQLVTGLEAVPAAQLTVAYEPVWAIGTGETASPEQAQEVHAAIRAWLAERYDRETAAALRILYGGSVKPANAAEILAKPDVDGVLVGGASLKADDFRAIIEAAG